jgi:transcriptional regulator with XRE-family HTH domain
MNEHQVPNTPFQTLGKHLKYLREQQDESLAEVSGAVEIDEHRLRLMEEGRQRPDEDILLLLISHFGMSDQEAVQIWELAGYDGNPQLLRGNEERTNDDAQKAVVMLVALDSRSLYTDGIEIACNTGGVVLNFTQDGGNGTQNTVSKVGMSYEQAEQVSRALQQALLRAKYLKGPKALPAQASPESE